VERNDIFTLRHNIINILFYTMFCLCRPTSAYIILLQISKPKYHFGQNGINAEYFTFENFKSAFCSISRL
jgi:hypothetical protein